MVKKDCFGFNNRCGVRVKDCCTVLKELYCATEECKFYKTKEQHEAEDAKRRKEQE